jgi:plastocyanin
MALACADTPVDAASKVQLLDAKGTPVAEAVVWYDGHNDSPLPVEPAIIEQVDEEFVPRLTVIRTGTRVQFPNRDAVSHHVYSFARPNAFELPLYQSGEQPSVRFDHAGVVTLGCNIHDSMLGYVVVVDSPHFAITDADGYANFATALPADEPVFVWSPRLDPSQPLQVTASADGKTIRVDRRQRTKARPSGGSLAWEDY